LHNRFFVGLITGGFICTFIIYCGFFVFAQAPANPVTMDDKFQVSLVTTGLKLPTAMQFLGPDDILVLEKDNGTVRRIVNGVILKEPVLDLSVANKYDRGILGLAITNKGDEKYKGNIRAFIYLTESKVEGSDNCLSWRSCLKGGEPEGNKLYRYEWNGSSLVKPKLLLDLPALPGPAHNGGMILLGPDDNVYLTTGDLRAPNTLAQNVRDGLPADGTSGILRITQDGKPVKDGILGDSHPLNKYYAYGIRNSFGMDFDPVTGYLWDTENGYLFGDEINMVKPGFNSGWAKVQGIWKIDKLDEDNIDALYHGKIVLDPKNLVEFDGKGKYSSPELFWNKSVGLTALIFLDSKMFGNEYQNDILVGDYYGKIYHFDLNKDRMGLENKKLIADKMADVNIRNNIFARGLGSITDIEVGPDGYVYVTSFYDGKIFRIYPKTSSAIYQNRR
jgi:glucose/arabinose dehydrogenase